MKKIVLLSVICLSLSANNIIIKNSKCSVNQTIRNIKHIVLAKGFTIFAIINHQKNAQNVNMKLAPTKEIIFGNPRLGTLFMQQDITTGLDLPIRILVYKNKNKKVKIAYRNGSTLALQHKIKLPKKIIMMNNALNKITNKAGQCNQD